MKKIGIVLAVFLVCVSMVYASEPNIQFRGVSYEDSSGNTILIANDVGDKLIVYAYVIDYNGSDDLKKMWLSYKGHNTDCDIRSTRTNLVNLICTATVESNMKSNTYIYLKVKEQDNSVMKKEIPYSPFDFQKSVVVKPKPEMWAQGFKVIDRWKYGVYSFSEVKDYYYAKVSISAGGILGDNAIEKSKVSVSVKGDNKEKIYAKSNFRDKPIIYALSDEEVIVEQRAYVRHTYYTKYNKTYSNGRVRESSQRHYKKGYTTLRYIIHPEERTALVTFDFNGKDFRLEVEDVEFMKQVFREGVSGRKVWVKY